MRTILGLDLGPNSIGWALVSPEKKKILGIGSRIIPMGEEKSKFEKGQAQTKNAVRRVARGMRKLNKRYKQRRNKLIYVLDKLGMLPDDIKLTEPFSDPLKLSKVCISNLKNPIGGYSAPDLIGLRVKALTEKVSLKELGRILYLFNQLRGYAGGDNEPDKNDEGIEEVTQEKKGKENFIVLANIVNISAPEIITVKNRETKKYRVTIKTEDSELEGETFLENLKVGESEELLISIRRSKSAESIVFTRPRKTSWRKKMENLEKQLILASKKQGREVYLSEYFREVVRENRWAKIRNNVILRSRYQSEFDAIWQTQSQYYPEILGDCNSKTLIEILSFIFPGNEDTQKRYREEGLKNGLNHIIRNQIIYYQRELKDQSHLISECRFEPGEKVAPKSHPIFQEYKIWEQINKLTINTKIESGVNRKGEVKYVYEDRPIPAYLKIWLFNQLEAKNEVGFKTILDELRKKSEIRENVDFLNGLNPKSKLRGNETKLTLKRSLGEQLWNSLKLDDIERQKSLWNILYYGKGNEYDLQSQRTSEVLAFLKDSDLKAEDWEVTAINISKIKFARAYSSVSLKAIEKVLPLIRIREREYDENLSISIKEKITRLLNEHVTDPFEKSLQEFLDKNGTEVLLNGGLMNAYAFMLVYGRHTAKEYDAREQIQNWKDIKRLHPGELRNPLVEQLVSEALMIVKDVWKHYKIKPGEIRIELSRDLKNNAERRAKIFKANQENQKTNEEVRKRLTELQQEITLANIEKYKIWSSQLNLQEAYIRQYQDPKRSEIEKVKLWEEQGHVSPYTGKPIPLGELFNRERYDVDHIIPKSRFFDDSFTNKIICEKAVNQEKNNKTAMEYFELGSQIPNVLTKENFINHVNSHFSGSKRKNLLAIKVPEDFVIRQIKETQYISIRVKEELNKIVGNANVNVSTGGITDYLREQWGLTEKFKYALLSRYERIKQDVAEEEFERYRKDLEEKKKEFKELGKPFHETVLDKEHYTKKFLSDYIVRKNNKLLIKGWTKRIDHRHHAIDALVVALTEPRHIQRLNDLNKELQKFLDEHRKEFLPEFEGSPSEMLEEILSLDIAKQKAIFDKIENFRKINTPWNGFTEDVARALSKIIVSQKPKDKLLIQPGTNGELQIKIRGQLHEATLYGKTNNIETYRIPLTKFAGEKFATEKAIEKIVDPFLRKQIKIHLSDYKDKKKEAFSIDGIERLNKRLQEGTNAKPHAPVNSIKIYYRDPLKQNPKKGEDDQNDALQRLDRIKSFNESLYVSTGDNYLFAVMEKGNKRIYDLITFFDAANLLKDNFNKAEEKRSFDKDAVFKDYFETQNPGTKVLFMLKQGDVVFLPVNNYEREQMSAANTNLTSWIKQEDRVNRILTVVKFSKKQIYFLQHNIATPIINKKEFGSQNCYEFYDYSKEAGGTSERINIKQNCVKIEIDRLGRKVFINQNIQSSLEKAVKNVKQQFDLKLPSETQEKTDEGKQSTLF
jgi:CRISPR subtype II RNA-guided endonuclease Cas9/Csn1